MTGGWVCPRAGLDTEVEPLLLLVLHGVTDTLSQDSVVVKVLAPFTILSEDMRRE
jgi:hypothetical protein